MIKIRFIIIPALAVTGIGLSMYTVRKQVPSSPVPPMSIEPPKSPFPKRIAGVGLVEPTTDVVSVGSPLPGVVARVAVVEGQKVSKGDVLFELDGRQTTADLAEARARLAVEERRLTALRALPRAPNVTMAEATLASARAQLVDAKGRLDRLVELGPEAAASRNERPRLEYELAAADAAVRRAEADLAEVKQGTWPEDMAVQEAQVEAARGAVQALVVMLERETVLAPISGTVLALEIDEGEFVSPGSKSEFVALGDVGELRVRVQIDELDAWRFTPECRAVAAPRGGSPARYPLTYLRTVPYVVPKKSLTGESAERIDVRVLQVLYRVDVPDGARLFPGELLDVFIEIPEGE
jgi:HlyD family secretion protein